MNRTSMLLSRSGPPDRTPWKTRSSGPSDFTTLYLRIALPALTSTVSPFSRWIRSTTQLFTPIVALEASLLGAPQSPRQNRSSIVIELAPISFQRKPASSLTLSPVYIDLTLHGNWRLEMNALLVYVFEYSTILVSCSVDSPFRMAVQHTP